VEDRQVEDRQVEQRQVEQRHGAQRTTEKICSILQVKIYTNDWFMLTSTAEYCYNCYDTIGSFKKVSLYPYS
jgi:hypothetical protein